MAKSTPETNEHSEETSVSKKSSTRPSPSSAQAAVSTAPEQGTYPGQTLGIVALVFTVFMPLPSVILGIIAWVWSNKAGKNNVLAKIAVFVGGAFTVIGVFLLGMWVALTAAAFGGPYGYGLPPGQVHIMDGGGHIMIEGDMGGMMHEFDQLEGEFKQMLPAPGDMPQLEVPQSN